MMRYKAKPEELEYLRSVFTQHGFNFDLFEFEYAIDRELTCHDCHQRLGKTVSDHFMLRGKKLSREDRRQMPCMYVVLGKLILPSEMDLSSFKLEAQ